MPEIEEKTAVALTYSEEEWLTLKEILQAKVTEGSWDPMFLKYASFFDNVNSYSPEQFLSIKAKSPDPFYKLVTKALFLDDKEALLVHLNDPMLRVVALFRIELGK